MKPFQGSVLRYLCTTDVTVATIMEPFQGWGLRHYVTAGATLTRCDRSNKYRGQLWNPSGFGVTLQVYHGRNRGYYNGTSSGFGVTLPVYHGRYRGYYNGTLSGLGIADTVITLLRAPH